MSAFGLLAFLNRYLFTNNCCWERCRFRILTNFQAFRIFWYEKLSRILLFWWSVRLWTVFWTWFTWILIGQKIILLVIIYCWSWSKKWTRICADGEFYGWLNNCYWLGLPPDKSEKLDLKLFWHDGHMVFSQSKLRLLYLASLEQSFMVYGLW